MFDIQTLIDNGMAWLMEGSIGRQCMAAIDNGQAMLGPVGHTDYWGNYVPSRYEVQPGTKGSEEYMIAMQETRDAEDEYDEWVNSYVDPEEDPFGQY